MFLQCCLLEKSGRIYFQDTVSQLHPPYHHATLPFVAANSATGPDNPSRCRRNKRHQTRFAGVFFSPLISCNGGCAWETFGSAGFLYLRFISLRTAATPFA
ncbi:hypothetical protein PflCFBP13510_20610 [Pseudomonas fluorescens]|nr:hypothetical protein PflCFBP13510_20610 [Pseudomonas fluorescens]